jgi:hypothetical protein
VAESNAMKWRHPDYNALMASKPEPRRLFSLQDAQDLLPTVKRLTHDAVQQADQVAERLQALPESDPDRDRLTNELNHTVMRWAAEIRALDLEVKGLWLVDFDNGEGYYCWKYPEASVTHYHGYDDGFAGRVPIH